MINIPFTMEKCFQTNFKGGMTWIIGEPHRFEKKIRFLKLSGTF